MHVTVPLRDTELHAQADDQTDDGVLHLPWEADAPREPSGLTADGLGDVGEVDLAGVPAAAR
ncbi:MAG TPA: hypothetical protein VK923_08935 [Euzebyales bacterium]|nr:hypothetical protein [Euzebyales bacterium]